jgi:hypothetical protein
MVYTHDVRAQIERYFADAVSLRELVLWLAAEGWELRERAPDALALDAIRVFDLAIGEYTGGHITRERLNECFREALALIPVEETTWTNITELNRRSSTSAHTQFAEACA